MAIPIQCPECHKRYQAPDHMAGRRVKCKYCGVVFLIAADSRTENPDFDLAQLDELAALGETGRHDPVKRGGTLAGGTTVGGKTGAPHSQGAGGAGAGAGTDGTAGAAAGGGSDIDDIFRGDFVETGARRTNKLYIFPMSRLLDRWLPPVMLAIGIVWVCREGWARNNTGQPWVGAFRAGVFLLAFFASVFPFTRMGIYAAARRLRYELPPKDNLRVLGTFAVPAALAAALWLIYQDVTGLLLGCLIGAVVAMPVLFLLFRLLPREAPVTFAYAAGTFFLSVFVASAALFALNLMLVGILRSTKTEHALASSPFGPGFRWEKPYREKNGRMVPANAGGDADSSAEDPAASTTQSAEGAGTDGAAGENPGREVRPSTTREATTGPALAESTGPSTPTVRPDTTGQGPTRVDPGGSPGTSPGRNPGETARTDAPSSFIPDVGPGNSGPAKGGIVKDVRTVFQGDGITGVVRPLAPGPWLAVVRPGVRGTDRVERWNTDTWKQAGEAVAAKDPDGNIYSISPDGDLLAYITDFPSLSIQVYSFAENKIVRDIRLKNNPRGDWGEARLLGFSRPDQLVVHWRRGQMLSGIEVHTLKGNNTAPRHFGVEDFDASPGTYAVSADGQTLSLLWRRGDTGGIASYALGTSKLIRSFPINVLDWRLQVRPAGLAFSPDGSSIAAVIEGEGQGLFAAWPAAGKPTRPNYKNVLPIGNGGDAFANGPANGFEGQAFEWLDEGRAFVLYGSSVFETESGQFLGDVGIEGVRAQIARGKNVCELVRMNDAGHVQVDVVTLDLSKARESGGAPAPRQRGSSPKPATRRASGAGSDTR